MSCSQRLFLRFVAGCFKNQQLPTDGRENRWAICVLFIDASYNMILAQTSFLYSHFVTLLPRPWLRWIAGKRLGYVLPKNYITELNEKTINLRIVQKINIQIKSIKHTHIMSCSQRLFLWFAPAFKISYAQHTKRK